ncbi:MAG: hypothetical protein HFJ20_04550 [Clostridia bacterium]|nr:hypothetical protein [Clostridia bacterium]
MEKIDKKIKNTFKNLFSNKEFTLTDALQFFNTYMSVDVDEAILNYKKDKVRALIGMKENGERIFVSFKKDKQYYYSNLNKEENLKNLDAMDKQLMIKTKGLQKTRKLVLKQKQNVIEGQVFIKEFESKENVDL